jgi:hypothetical protein
MMITMCSKFGTRACGAAFGVGGVNVGETDAGVCVAVADGTGTGVVAKDCGELQATSKIKRRMQIPNRVIRVSMIQNYSALSVPSPALLFSVIAAARRRPEQQVYIVAFGVL